jgi:hypothetical protein
MEYLDEEVSNPEEQQEEALQSVPLNQRNSPTKAFRNPVEDYKKCSNGPNEDRSESPEN